MSAVWEDAVEVPTLAIPSLWTPLEQLPWKFAGRVTLDGIELYAWTRANIWETDWHTIPVAEFWPAPRPTIRRGSIWDRIAEHLGWKRPDTQQDYALASGKATP